MNQGEWSEALWGKSYVDLLFCRIGVGSTSGQLSRYTPLHTSLRISFAARCWQTHIFPLRQLLAFMLLHTSPVKTIMLCTVMKTPLALECVWLNMASMYSPYFAVSS